jgi:hypothetical protein
MLSSAKLRAFQCVSAAQQFGRQLQHQRKLVTERKDAIHTELLFLNATLESLNGAYSSVHVE